MIKSPEENIRHWNGTYKVGHPVRYWNDAECQGAHVVSKTTGEAFIRDGVAMVELAAGEPGWFVPLRQIRPLRSGEEK